MTVNIFEAHKSQFFKNLISKNRIEASKRLSSVGFAGEEGNHKTLLGSPDPSRINFEVNVGKRRVRQRTAQNFIEYIFFLFIILYYFQH